jgi:hypothetical protein
MRVRADQWLALLSIAVAVDHFSTRSYAGDLDPDKRKSYDEALKAQKPYLVPPPTLASSVSTVPLEEVFQDLESGDKDRVLNGLDTIIAKTREIESRDRAARNNHEGVRLINAFDKIIQELGPSSGTGGLVIKSEVEDKKIFDALIRSVMHTFFVWDENPFTKQIEILWPNYYWADVDPFPASTYIEAATESAVKRGWPLEEISAVLTKHKASLKEGGFPASILKSWVNAHPSKTPGEFDQAVALLQKTWKAQAGPTEIDRAPEQRPSNSFIRCLLRHFKLP